jgi:uncharacterized membrane protein YeaQ/YmgE (transglycosylase-associated protein family)
MSTHRLAMVGLLALPLMAQRGDRGGLDIESILGYVVVGAIVGIIARLLIPGTGGMGFLITIVVGIVGAVIGGWLAGNVWEETEGVDWIASILVAALLVWIVARAGFGSRWGRRTY